MGDGHFMADIFLTQEGLDKLTEELKQLKQFKRQEIIRHIQEARAHGDLSENAEYDAAKEAQAFNENRIHELEDQLTRAKIIDQSNVPVDKLCVGKKVEIKNLTNKQVYNYQLVSVEEADFEAGKLAITSPLGKALVGRMKGDEVEVKAPAGTTKYKVLGMSM
jgi:transcription elongation factor GreA